MKPTILILEITLLETNPPVWRIVELKDTFTLHELHAVIQCAMGWKNSHLYSFSRIINGNNIEYILPDYAAEDNLQFEGNNPRLVKLKQIFENTGESLRYLYDFGDSWVHEVRLKGKRYPDGIKNYPYFLSGAMACPPEDLGGIPGYLNLLYLIHTKSRKELKEFREWLGYKYDPYELDNIGGYLFYKNYKRILRL